MSALSRLVTAPWLLALLALAAPGALPAAPLKLAFLPPEVEEQNLCGPAPEPQPVQHGAAGAEAVLTAPQRARYLQRDIRRYQNSDPDRYFDFITTLRKRLSSSDPRFAGAAEVIDLIGLHIDANRLETLQESGLVHALAASRPTLTNGQRMQLAHYYLTGIGVPQDQETGFDLIREAAYGGHAEALLYIARRMAEGRPLPGWDAPEELTVTMAFGGLLGQMDAGVCARAERIGREYLTGGIVRRNPDIGWAWYRFAADLGSASAAWRMVEHHLSATAEDQDIAEMQHYLRRAVARGIVVDDGAKGRLAAGGLDADTLRDILAFNQPEDRGRRRPSLTPLLQTGVNIDAMETSPSGPYLTYLREIAAIPDAPGRVFTQLARELSVRLGRWAGEAEIIAQLEIAAARNDPDGMRALAARLLRYRDDPAQLNRAIDLLTLAATRHDDAAAMNDLDRLFRCQAPEAPLLRAAAPWARAYRATGHRTVALTPSNLMALDPYKDPWRLARLQSQALDGRSLSLARYLQLVQRDPIATETMQRLWADRADSSDKTLEEVAKLEFELATNPAERALALEFFRRVYLNNGVTTALDLAVAMINDSGMNPAMAAEVRQLLRQASHRGEGAAIRLLARLGKTPEAERQVFDAFARIIDERGDFLALMFALPHVAETKRADYFDRAVSLMACSTKDTDELGEAHARHGSAAMSFHWRRIGLAIEGHNTLSKLRLSNSQIAGFDTRRAPQPDVVTGRDRATDLQAQWRLFHLTARSDLESYDPQAAAAHFKTLVTREGTLPRAFEHYLSAPPALRRAIDAALDFEQLIAGAARSGDPQAMWRHARLLQDQATTPQALTEAIGALRAAARAGAVPAMRELGQMLAMGAAVPHNETEALEWLDKAATAGDQSAAAQARWLRLR